MMKIRFVLYVGNNEYIKEMQFAYDASERTIEKAFREWKAGLFYSFWEQVDD